MPHISVCIPIYNPGPHLRTAVLSVLAQIYDDYELILVDDCSSSPVDPILAEFHDERIRFEKNSNNLGIPANWNRCLDLARGDYITIFHQDDVMLPGNLSQKVAILDAQKDIGFVYSNVNRIDSFGKAIGGHHIPQPSKDMIMPGWELFRMVSQTGNPIACPTVLARKECYEQVGYFDERLKFAVDLEMWMRIAKKYSIAYLSEPLVEQRVHEYQETMRFLDTGKDYIDVMFSYDIAYANPIPKVHSQFKKQTYQTLAYQSYVMARWSLRQKKIRAFLLYTGVVFQSNLRMLFPLRRHK